MTTARARGRLSAVGSVAALLMTAGVGTTEASILNNCNSQGQCKAPIEAKKPAPPSVDEKVIPGTPAKPGKSGDAPAPASRAPQAGPAPAPVVAPKPLTAAQKKAQKKAAAQQEQDAAVCTQVVMFMGGSCGGEVTATLPDEVPASTRPASTPGRPGTPARTVRTVSVSEVVEKAKAKIKLPKPDIGSAPCTGAGCKGTVGVPTWFWLDGDEWKTRTDSASAGGHTVRVTAKPSKVKWSLGDGQSVTCTGPGKKYEESMGWATSPDCGLENGYKKAGSYNVTAAITYDVTVTGAMDDSETVTRSSSEPITVREIQTVIK